jgi:hypothetical protein
MLGNSCNSYDIKHKEDRAICHYLKVDVPHLLTIRGPSEKFVDWRQYAAVMQREAVTVMPRCSGEGNVVVA